MNDKKKILDQIEDLKLKMTPYAERAEEAEAKGWGHRYLDRGPWRKRRPHDHRKRYKE